MANLNEIKSQSQRPAVEEYIQRLIMLPFQPIISHSDDISETRCSQYFY